MRSTVDDEIGTTMQIIGESLCEAVDVMPDERVLDVATGNGNATLAAARRGAEVTASDDAEALALPDASFDVVLSMFGAMFGAVFAPQQERVAAELVRVCRPGGRIGLANWTPDSFVGRVFKVVRRYVPAPAAVRSPLEWGTRPRIGELFERDVDSIGVCEREFVLRYRSSRAWLDAFRRFYRPTYEAFAALDADGQTALEHDLLALAATHNTSPTGWRVPSPYLEVVIVKVR
jgi:SAM-dependent methyltransferase